MTEKCGNSVKHWVWCILEKGHLGNCAAACNEEVPGRYYRKLVKNAVRPERCALPKRHGGRCKDRLGNDSYQYPHSLKDLEYFEYPVEFSVFDEKKRILTSYDKNENILSEKEIKEVEK